MATKKAEPGGPAAPKIADATLGDVASALVPRDYFRLPAAAHLLGLKADDLVHMAKQGALRLCVLGGCRSFRVVDIVERQRVTGRTDGGPKISVEQHAMRIEETAVDRPIEVPVQFVVELEAMGKSTPRYFDDDDEGRMLIPLVPFQVSTDDLVIRAVEFDAIRGPRCEGRTQATTGQRANAMAVEIEYVLSNMLETASVTAGTLMPLLRSRAGLAGSCIVELAGDGVMFRQASGKKDKLSIKDLKDRLYRRKERLKSASMAR